MFALVYVSQSNYHFDEEDIHELESQSCTNNQKLAVTGYLNYKKEKFLQYLEGEEVVVGELMNTIAQDKRHKVLRTLLLPSIDERLFEDCYMRYWTHNELVEIKMDDMLEWTLLKMSEHIYGEEKLRHRATQLVKKMAEMHTLHPKGSY